MSLCDRLKQSRLYLDVSQKEMAELTNVSYSAWQKYEQGTSVPGGNVFESLVKLGFNINWFFGDDVPMMVGDSGGAASPKAAAQGQEITGTDLEAMPSDNLGLGESVELLAKIYNSGNTVLIRAIAANLHAFSEAVDNKALAIDVKRRMGEMEERMTAMEKKLAQATAAPPPKAANG